MVKLSMIQGCPSFDYAAINHIKAVVARAKNDSAQQNCIAELDYSKSRADRAVLTDEDTENFLEVCSQQGDRLAAARAQVILLIGCATGFRACGMIHLTYYNMIRTEPNQYNTAHPQQLDILGVGTDRHKTLSTGKVVYTGLTRQAMAEKDAVAAIGELLALEVHSSCLALLEQMQHGEKTWGRVKILFPGYVDLSEKAQTDKISNLFNRITGQLQGWDKSKVTGLLRKTCVETLRAADASKAEVDFHGGWNGGTQDRNYARESLQADMKAQAKQQGLSKIFVSTITLGEQTCMCQKLGTMHCCQVFKLFLMLCWTCHAEYVRPCSALSCLCKPFGRLCQLKRSNMAQTLKRSSWTEYKRSWQQMNMAYLQPMSERQSLTVWRSLASRFPT